MSAHTESPGSLLEAVYRDLGFDEGTLLDASADPTPSNEHVWLDKGDWLTLASTVKAEKVFFVDDNPVIVFARHDATDSEALRDLFNRIWCMSRPQLLFLATPGNLSVIDLTKPPPGPRESVLAEPRVLHTVKAAAKVVTELTSYHRDRVESGKLFEEERFGKGEDRADRRLVEDLRTVRKQLMAAGLKMEHAHALIGRSIFIRYLEDRGVLKRDFFDEVVGSRTEWTDILDASPTRTYGTAWMADLLYPKVLGDKDFTYALFKHLSVELNGDMFPEDADERESVKPEHLRLLSDFLTGAAETSHTLFFFAYRFDVIPIELISSIYEEFYSKETRSKQDHGTHYTPSALVEYVLGQVLTPDCLKTNPRILDPACGSGIFLVEAFRRVVRHQVGRVGRRLEWHELRQILQDQIAGIDINPQAIRVAAFSLYLALLHYQEPPDILEHRLPHLVWPTTGKQPPPDEYYDILLRADAFDVGSYVSDQVLRQRFESGCADVIVGNPPWSNPKKDGKTDQSLWKPVEDWCARRQLSVGDKEMSQAFLHRTTDMLRDGGHAGLLVSTGVFFKESSTSRNFRGQWLAGVTLANVTNFAHVRDVFFATGIAPFASVYLRKRAPELSDHRFQFWSARKTAAVPRLRTVVLSYADLKLVPQHSVLCNDDTWKVYWWGSHRDEALVRGVQLCPPLTDACVGGKPLTVGKPGSGFERRPLGEQLPSDWLRNYRELPVTSFRRYGPLNPDELRVTPETVYRRGKRQVYDGLRLLFKRGMGAAGLVARLEDQPFCFKHSMQAIRLNPELAEEAKVALGIYWSSLARYYFWMTCGSWGTWHDEIHLEVVMSMPIRLGLDPKLTNRIVQIVDELRFWDGPSDLRAHRLAAKERELDEAIFDLYELGPAERDLVLDMCDVGLDLFYNDGDSQAVDLLEGGRPAGEYGVIADLPSDTADRCSLEGYLRTFLLMWSRELEPNGEFRWRVIRPRSDSPMVAVVFSTQFRDAPLAAPDRSDESEWQDLLRRLDSDSRQPVSKRIYIDGLVRVVSDADIVIIKRNERRFWTRSMAREDAEATLLQAMYLQEPETR